MERPLVALTFDDGPSAYRPATLEALRGERAVATFFDVGVRVRANPHLVRFAAEEGHLVLNHTLTHPPLTELGAEAVRRELLDAEEAFAEAGVAPPFRAVRPPFLALDAAVSRIAAALGFSCIGGYGPPDYLPATTAAEIRDGVLAHLEPGAVVVLHDGAIDSSAGAETVAALPAVVRGIRAAGFELGGLDATGAVVPRAYRGTERPVPPVSGSVPFRPPLGG
ncbi:chitooligosaccharide deacetylase [Motilibacter rhizosphaerae]|uniref:Chitooligosaccharide deacetylase n=1 Tax=Motilibacter rhizosphaerae TaxID=598652 RepID=A0A4Q7NAD1_9ACTN|nr:polysaccharide deacetylase family protein [Motilibacter rhizosphaerae]RZS79027.1 chitooligosaccharide deacetylase [Motilibacter rhizosphaerae]